MFYFFNINVYLERVSLTAARFAAYCLRIISQSSLQKSIQHFPVTYKLLYFSNESDNIFYGISITHYVAP